MFLAGGYSVFGDGKDNFEWGFVMLYPTAFEQFYQEVLGCITTLKKLGPRKASCCMSFMPPNLPGSMEDIIKKSPARCGICCRTTWRERRGS